MLIKLDMANAFDRVNHSFLLQVLRSFGFPTQFINLIKTCISNPWIAPMVNGHPTSFFQAHRRLRQGCPLSPFLYILMEDTLGRKLAAEMNIGGLPGIQTANALKPINHALFGDNSLLLGRASIRIAANFDYVLKSYCRTSGAVINDRKSSIYGWNVSQHNLNTIAQVLGFECFTHWDSIKYLGLPLTSGVNNRSLWHGIISKIKDKITTWGDPTHPVSETLTSKYEQGISLRHLSANNTPAGTHTWNLCRKCISSFRNHLYRIPGNGDKILLWKDRIMNSPPLNSHEEIRELREWLHRAAPQSSRTAQNVALKCSTGPSQQHRQMGWGESRSYALALGYIALQPKKDRLRSLALWKQVWNTNGLPKVNFFFWILMQNKQLTGDNLSKRNIVGPHRCAMCRNSGDTTSHLFIDCDFAKEVWKLTLLGLHASPPQHSSVADLFTDWFQCYPHNIPNNSLWFYI
eukprot:PITA_30936